MNSMNRLSSSGDGNSDEASDPYAEIATTLAEVKSIQDEFHGLLPLVAQARRTYFNAPNEATRAELEVIEQRAGELHARHVRLGDRLQELTGITDKDLDDLRTKKRSGDEVDRQARAKLTIDEIEPTSQIEKVLDASLDKLLALVGPRVLAAHAEMPRPRLGMAGQPLSLVRGVRPESERPAIHRFAQALLVTRDFLNEDLAYDHFAGALLVPQTATLAGRLDVLREIAGAQKRLKSLWRRASDEVDSTIFELLVGAGCAAMGRNVEFLEAGNGKKTPDLMCHDPYPLAIECKRKRPLSEYEILEEQSMRALFIRLDSAARSIGVWGRFHLVLEVEASSAPLDDIVAKLILQRFAGGATLEYDWGRVTFIEASAVVDFARPTRLYSPNMLEHVFAWNSDLPEFDGLICRVANDSEPVIDSAERPVGLAWTNLSLQALKKRSWGPMGVVSEALEQIPSGDFGIVYVAYQEGAREGMADSRLAGFSERISDIEHRNDIRVPVCKLVRLYPRALGDGAPDLIESTVPYRAEYGDDVLPTKFPSRVFTTL